MIETTITFEETDRQTQLIDNGMSPISDNGISPISAN